MFVIHCQAFVLCGGKNADTEDGQLTIPVVSNLRELLIAFTEEMQDIGLTEMDSAEQVVDIYMKSN